MVINKSLAINQTEAKQWLKAILFAFLLVGLMFAAHATDQIDIEQLNKPASSFQNGIKMFAKWGGILMIVVAGIVFGSGQAQGQTAKLIFGIVLGMGCIMGAWGYFSANFSYGFAF